MWNFTSTYIIQMIDLFVITQYETHNQNFKDHKTIRWST